MTQLTWPEYDLDSIHKDSQRDEGIQMDVKAIGPLHRLCLSRLLHEHVVAHNPGKNMTGTLSVRVSKGTLYLQQLYHMKEAMTAPTNSPSNPTTHSSATKNLDQ